MKEKDLCERLFNFAVQTIKILKFIKGPSSENIIKFQLIKSATSSGANYEEAQGASSKADFLNKVRIALKEMRESNYWLRILQQIESGHLPEIAPLVKESEELKNILGAICKKTNENRKKFE